MYDWIDEQAIPPLPAGIQLALFGAGEGSSQFLAWLAENAPGARVLAVADNDPTQQGREYLGLPIIEPAALPGLKADLVVVTTVSGREAVGGQLAAMGLLEGKDFVRIGAYPAAGLKNLLPLLEWDRSLGGILREGGAAVHVGPGGFLGLECGLYALRGMRTTAVDAYSFGLDWPEVTGRRQEYEKTRTAALRLAGNGTAEDVGRRWDSLFAERDGRLFLEGIPFRFPHDFSALPVDSASMDLACSFAVLEHVRDPRRCVEELWRVLKPGGVAVQTIVTRDHRSFGKTAGYTPISYRVHSSEEWERINQDRFYQNRLAPWQWRELFAAVGFEERHYHEHGRYVPGGEEYAALHPDFQGWSEDRMSAVDCTLLARKM